MFAGQIIGQNTQNFNQRVSWEDITRLFAPSLTLLTNLQGKILLKYIYLFTLFALTRQFPLISYSWLMNVGVVLIFICSWRGLLIRISRDLLVLCFLSLLCVACFYSMYVGNDPVLVVRFFSVIMFVLLAYYINIDGESVIKWFVYILSFQAVIVIIIEIYMVTVFGTGPYGGARSYFLNSNFGDVYTYGSGFYKVQIKGNALLPVAFMLSSLMFRYKREFKYLSVSCLLLVGIVFSGNFAFYIAVFLFATYLIGSRYFTKKKIVKFFAISMIAAVATVFIAIPYTKSMIESKSDGSSSSMGTRYDQWNVLIDDATSSWASSLLGKGLGNIVNVETSARDYSGYIYYELQAVYIYNQLGPVLFLFFVVCNLFLIAKYIKSSIAVFVYGLYCLYAASNPYMLDTNHVLLIIILISFSSYTCNIRNRGITL